MLHGVLLLLYLVQASLALLVDLSRKRARWRRRSAHPAAAYLPSSLFLVLFWRGFGALDGAAFGHALIPLDHHLGHARPLVPLALALTIVTSRMPLPDLVLRAFSTSFLGR